MSYAPPDLGRRRLELTSKLGVKKLYHIIRTPTWIPPPRIHSWKILGRAQEILSNIQIDSSENFSQETIEKFESDPEFYRNFVKGVEAEVNNTFPIVRKLACPSGVT